MFQQLVGINVVFYYGAVLWQAVGFSESDALKINILSGAISIASCVAAIALIDRIGRKPLLLIGSAGMAITLAIMSVAFMSGSLVDGTLELSDGAGLAALIAANVYVAFFNFSWGPVMWVMLGEMFPNQIRGSGLAVSGFAQWISNFGITHDLPDHAGHDRPERRLRLLRDQCGDLGRLRVADGARDEGHGTGRHAGLAWTP